MKDCNPNSKFNCSPYIKYLFLLFIAGLAIASCTQEVRVEDDINFDSAILLIENEYDMEVIDRVNAKSIASDLFPSGTPTISSKIDKITKYQDELYFYLESENKLKVYDNNNYTFVTEYDFNSYGSIGDISFPNISNFYVTLPSSNEVLIVDRINQQISSFLIPVDENPNKLLALGNLLFVGCKNSINVIRTGTKKVENKIEISGEVLLFSHDLDKNSLLVITANEGIYSLEYYDVTTLQQINKVELKSNLLEEGEELKINQIAIVTTDLEYSWLATSIGLIRIDLRNLGTYTVISKRKEEILNVYYEPVSSNIILLSSRNGLKDYVLSDPQTGEFLKTFPISDNANYIFPL